MTKHDLKSVLGHSHRHTTITHITMDDSKQSLAMSSPVQVEEEEVMQVAEEDVSAPAHQFEPPPLQLTLFSQIAGEMVKLDLLEDADNEATLDILIGDCMEDYPDDDQSEMAQYAAKIARASITDQTRVKHIRYVYPGQNLLDGDLTMPGGSSKPSLPSI